MSTDWTIELTRTCRACKGSGRFERRPSSAPGQTEVKLGPDPVECQTCHGAKIEQRSMTIEELKDLLSL
jgi:DnaJ-class molecular chaperone